jgi:uncharacterized membrane protein YczE
VTPKTRSRHHHTFISGELALIVGLIVNSFSVTLFAKSDVGMSTISLTAYVLSLVFSVFSFGTWSYIIQCSLVVVLVGLLRRIKAGYAISFGIAVVYGLLIDFFYQLVLKLPDTLPLHILYYVLGFCGMAFGTCLLFKCRIPVLPFDTFTRDIALHFHLSYKIIRTTFDVSCLVFSAGLGFFYIGSCEGIGVGTLINALFMGMAVSKVSDLLERRFYFQPVWAWIGKLS